MELFQTVTDLIHEYGLLRNGDGVIVGCSGGPDSMCLLHLLMKLQETMDLHLRVVHLEHGFRGEASEQDARYVEQFCNDHGIDCVVHREQVRERARQSGISDEAAGREARYELFFAEREKFLEELCAGRASIRDAATPQVKIAVAHNKNDQAETILMRILRGTGLEGLCGMEIVREDGIIRPLLTTERRDIEAYCEEHQLHPRQDHTNQENEYTRNRIRLELIPYLKHHFNDNVEDALCRLGSIASESQEVIRVEADRVKDRLHHDVQGRIDDRSGLVRLDRGLRHELIRRELKHMGLTMNVSLVHLHQIDGLLQSSAASGSTDLPQGYRVAVAYDRILWKPPSAVTQEDENGASNAVAGRITVRHSERRSEDTLDELRKLPENVKCFDGRKVMAALEMSAGSVTEKELTLRCRKPGDVIRPLGSPGRKKLQDWFVDRKIPRQVRDGIPLVCIGNEVLWIMGYQISENYKVDAQTNQLIFVEFHQ